MLEKSYHSTRYFFFFFLMIRRPPRSTLFPYTTPLPISVELARRLVGAGQEDAEHVQPDRDHHAVRGPAVHVPHEHAEGHVVLEVLHVGVGVLRRRPDRKSTRLNSSHLVISYAVFCLNTK